MSDKQSNDSRRKLLKSLAAGSGAVVAGKSLPESWSKPVINSVMLPAHAETTDATTTPVPLNYFGDLPVIGDARLIQICIQCVSGNCSAKLLEGDTYYYEGSGSLGADFILAQLTDCDLVRVVLTVETVSDVATGQFVFLYEDETTSPSTAFSIPMAACGISAADDSCVD